MPYLTYVIDLQSKFKEKKLNSSTFRNATTTFLKLCKFFFEGKTGRRLQVHRLSKILKRFHKRVHKIYERDRGFSLLN